MRMRAERDRWMERAKREDCEGGTDGAQKGDGSGEGNGGLRKKRGTELTERRGRVCVWGGRRRKDKSEKALLTLAVSQAICVTMLHVLLKG